MNVVTIFRCNAFYRNKPTLTHQTGVLRLESKDLPIDHLFFQIGYDKLGLPIGLQLLGRPWCEATLLRVASAIEVYIFHE